MGVDDEIREGIKEINRSLLAGNKDVLLEKAEETVDKLLEMILRKKKFFSQWL